MTSPVLPSLTARPRTDLSSRLVRQILDLIRRGDLKPGERLPPAKALADRFGVATPTVREALRRLQATGLIDIRHGSGIFIRRDAARLMLANPDHDLLGLATIPDLLEARLLIEPHLAERAAGRITEAELAELERLMREAERFLVDNDEPLMRVNMAFHAAIARASGNTVLANVMESLIELYSSEQLAITSLYNARAEDHREHLLILAALRARDPGLARERMRRHLGGVKAVIEARLTERASAGPAAPAWPDRSAADGDWAAARPEDGDR